MFDFSSEQLDMAQTEKRRILLSNSHQCHRSETSCCYRKHPGEAKCVETCPCSTLLPPVAETDRKQSRRSEANLTMRKLTSLMPLKLLAISK